MAGAIVNLSKMLARLATNAGEAADEMDRAATSSGRLPKDQPGRSDSGIVTDEYTPPVPFFRGYGAQGRTSFEEWSGEVEEVTTEMRDFLAELRGGKGVGDLVPNQRDVIEQIENTPFGSYLGRAAELMIEKLTEGFRLSPERNRIIQEALYAKDIGARDIIKRLTGKAGKEFNWSQFEADIKALVAAQQNMKQVADKMTNAMATNTRQSRRGRMQVSLSVLRHAGAIK